MASLVNKPLTITNSALSSTLEDLSFSDPSSPSSNSNSNQSNLDASIPVQSIVVKPTPAGGASLVDSATDSGEEAEPDSFDFLDQTQQDQTATAPAPASALAHSPPPASVLPDSASMDRAPQQQQQQQQPTLVVPIMAGAGALLLLVLLIIFMIFRLRRLRQRRIERIMNSISMDFGYIELVGGLRGKQREGVMGKLMGKDHSIDSGRTGNWDLALAMAQEFVLDQQQQLQQLQQQSDPWSEFPEFNHQIVEPLPPRLPEPVRIPGIRISECSTLAPNEFEIAI